MIDIQYVIACDKYNPIGKSWWIRYTSDLQSSILVSSSFELWGYMRHNSMTLLYFLSSTIRSHPWA